MACVASVTSVAGKADIAVQSGKAGLAGECVSKAG